MTLQEIRDMPTTLDTGHSGNRVHESCFRSYQIMLKIVELLEQKVPPQTILEIIADCRMAPMKDKSLE